MRRRPIPLLSRAELEALPTKALMARRKRLLQCEESLALSDDAEALVGKSDPLRFKDQPQWNGAYEDLLSILAERENVATGAEARELRSNRSQSKRSRELKSGR